MDDVQQLAADLANSEVTPAQARVAVRSVCENVKATWRENASGLAHARAYPFSIGYSTQERPFGADAEVGPDKDRAQGPLGNLLEYGSVNNAPGNHGGQALDRHQGELDGLLADLGFRGL